MAAKKKSKSKSKAKTSKKSKTSKKNALPAGAKPETFGGVKFRCYGKRVGTRGGGTRQAAYCRRENAA